MGARGGGGEEMDLAQFAERSPSLRIEFAAWQLIALLTGQPYQGFVSPYPLSNPIIQPTFIFFNLVLSLLFKFHYSIEQLT